MPYKNQKLIYNFKNSNDPHVASMISITMKYERKSAEPICTNWNLSTKDRQLDQTSN